MTIQVYQCEFIGPKRRYLKILFASVQNVWQTMNSIKIFAMHCVLNNYLKRFTCPWLWCYISTIIILLRQQCDEIKHRKVNSD